MATNFQLKSKFSPAGDQPKAIRLLSAGVDAKISHQTLLGVTGSGKTFTMASIIENVQKPTLIISHNKTLAAQLYSEFREFFPNNAVHYFVSYYDYYQPEAYVPKRDLYIEKEADINKDIERYRNAATQSLLTRKDVIIVASVSCIYGLGNPDNYMALSRNIKKGSRYNRNKLIRHLTDLRYERSEHEFCTGQFRVRGDSIDIFTAGDDFAVKIEFFGDEVETIKVIHAITGEIHSTPTEITIFPAKHFVTPFVALKNAIPKIEQELSERIKYLKKHKRKLEAYRIEQRVNYDIEMLRETGYCSGIENYSRFIENRTQGSPPSTLLDYYPDDFLTFIDESHMTVPQIRAMYHGDRVRKQTLVEYGFRLPSALDNRPLKFPEFNNRMNQIVYTSATPAEYEMDLSRQSAGSISRISKHKPNKFLSNYTGIVEQLIRPTGLLDPVIEVRPSEAGKKLQLTENLKAECFYYQAESLAKHKCSNQVDDLITEIQRVIKKSQRVLITTLTKKMAESLASYLSEIGIKVQYLHCDISTVERVEILRDLRLGKFDVLVGINLLREGLDLPEVSLVVILDADKEGFLRSEVSLIQTIGRAARHKEGRIIMYADKVTKSMRKAIQETGRRRKIQQVFNKKHGIKPVSIKKNIQKLLEKTEKQKKTTLDTNFQSRIESYAVMSPAEKKDLKQDLNVQMLLYSDMLEFEKAAEIRDVIAQL